MIDAPESKKSKLRSPGPFWVWLIAAIVFSQIVKRVFIGWPLPKAENFRFGNRFMENFAADSLIGLPILLIYLACLFWMNRATK